MSQTTDSRRQRAPIIPGILLILLGLWLLGRQIDLPLIVERTVWPLLIVLFGLVIWARYIFFPPRVSSDVFWGTAGVLTGAFLFAWLNNYILPEASGWGTLWPIIPLIIGVSTLVEWIFSIWDWGNLVFGAAAAAVGVLGMLYTTGRISSATAWSIAQFWPLLVILAGLGLLLQVLIPRRPTS